MSNSNSFNLLKKQLLSPTNNAIIHNRFVLPINMGNLRGGILILYKYDPQEASLIQQRKEQIRQEDEQKHQAAEAERVKNKAEYEELNRRYIESRTEDINDARNASRGLGGKRTRVKRKIRKTKKLK